jgi:peptidoglycan-associated lipoprotein
MNKGIAFQIAAATALCVLGSACAHKQTAVNTPPAPQPAAAPAPSQPRQVAATPRPAPPQQVAQASPRSSYPDAATRARIDELIGRIQDAYFEYNRHTLSDAAVKTLNGDATELSTIMAQYPTYKLQVQGYCDERGSAEYNIALGEARAEAAKNYLVSMGVSPTQLTTISYGKEKQVCDEHDEACWSKNRRVHIVALASNSH